MPYSPKDKKKIQFNPISGQFDLISEFNADRIVTHRLNQWGNPIMLYDPIWNKYYEAHDIIVTDSNGNVVVV